MNGTKNNKGLLRVAIVGGGRRCNEMLEMVALGELKVEVIGVADIDPNAEGIKSARKKGIYTTSDFKDLYKIEGLDLIIELTGNPEVYHKINQTKPQDIQAIGYIAARLFWDIVSDERKAKSNYMTLAESSPTGIYIYQDQGLKFVNKRFVEMFGYAKEELIGMGNWDWGVIHPLDRKTLRKQAEKRLKGEDVPSRYECRGITKDGRTLWLEVRATAIEYQGRPAILINAQDVTERRQAEEATKLAHAELNQIFNTAADGMRVIDRDFNVLRINETLLTLLGITKDEAVGKKCYEVFHGPLCHTSNCPLTRILSGEQRVECNVEKERNDGVRIPCILTATFFREIGGEVIGIVESFKDITEHKSMEEALRTSEQRYKNLYKKTKVLAERDSLTDLFNRRRIGEFLENEIERAKRKEEVFSVMMLDVDDLKLINDAYGHVVGDRLLVNVAKALKNSCRSVDLIGRYGGDEFMIILPHTHGEKAGVIAQRICEKIRQQGLKINGIRNIPIRLSIGVATYPFDSMVPKELITLADRRMYESKQSGETVVSVSIPGVKEYLAAKEPTLSVLEGLVTAVDGKDHYTKAHSELVTKFSLSLGKELNLSHEEMEALRIAGLLHDIGKIGIPENILKKPGPLETKEFELIKQHPRLGAMMLDGPPPHREYVIDAINYHHERYDGKGYPGGLKGEEIPLLARIIGIVDAYCAMITDRPYRKALTQEEAIAELKKGAGTQFDPELVAKFIKCIKESKF